MPWSETSPLNERHRFIRDYRSGLYGMTELCRRFRISRKTGYQWVGRFEEQGAEGLEERSRAPKHYPPRMDERWLGRSPKRGALLRRGRRRSWWPGLRRATRRSASPAEEANDLWTADDKGKFRSGAHERTHRTLEEETASPPLPGPLRDPCRRGQRRLLQACRTAT
jgi:transposase